MLTFSPGLSARFSDCLMEIRDDPVTVDCISGFARTVAAEFSVLFRSTLSVLRLLPASNTQLPALSVHPMYVVVPFTRVPSNILASVFDSCRQFTDTDDALVTVLDHMIRNLAFPLVKLPDGDTWALVRIRNKMFLIPRRCVLELRVLMPGLHLDRVCQDPDGVSFLTQFMPAIAWSPASDLYKLYCVALRANASPPSLSSHDSVVCKKM